MSYIHTHTRLMALCPGLPGWAGTRKVKLDFTEARDSEWQWHQLGYMQLCTSLQTDNHASTPPLSFFTGRMPFLPPNQQYVCQSKRNLREHCWVVVAHSKCLLSVHEVLLIWWTLPQGVAVPGQSSSAEEMQVAPLQTSAHGLHWSSATVSRLEHRDQRQGAEPRRQRPMVRRSMSECLAEVRSRPAPVPLTPSTGAHYFNVDKWNACIGEFDEFAWWVAVMSSLTLV